MLGVRWAEPHRTDGSAEKSARTGSATGTDNDKDPVSWNGDPAPLLKQYLEAYTGSDAPADPDVTASPAPAVSLRGHDVLQASQMGRPEQVRCE